MAETITIGSDSGFSEDQVEAARDLARLADIDDLIIEALRSAPSTKAIRASSGTS